MLDVSPFDLTSEERALKAKVDWLRAEARTIRNVSGRAFAKEQTYYASRLARIARDMERESNWLLKK
jgi:hypothetical protein